MTLKQLTCTALLMLSFGVGHSQITQKRNQFEFSVGYNLGSLMNLEFAPVSRYGFNNNIYKFNYERTGKKQNIFEIELDFFEKTALTNESIPRFNAAYTRGDLNFSFLKHVHHKNSLCIHLGLQTQSSLSFLDNDVNYYAAHQMLGIAGRLGYQINEKHYLSSKLTIPFFTARGTNAAVKLLSFNRYQSVLWNLKYEYALTKHFHVKTTYDFNYNRLQGPGIYREFQHQINLGITYNF